MARFMSLSLKMALLIGFSSFMVFLAGGVLVYINVERHSAGAATAIMENVSKAEARKVEAMVEDVLNQGRTLANSLTYKETIPPEVRRETVTAMLKGIMEHSPHVFGISTIWRNDSFDGRDAELGPFQPFVFRMGTDIGVRDASEMAGEGSQDSAFIDEPLSTGGDYITEPALMDLGGQQVTLVRLSLPIPSSSGSASGVVVVDIDLGIANASIKETTLFRTGFLRLVSPKGMIIGHKDAAMIGQAAPEWTDARYADLLARAVKGETVTGVFWSETDKAFTSKSFVPVFIGSHQAPFVVGTMVPLAETMDETYGLLRVVAIVLSLGAVFLVAVIAALGRAITRPIVRTQKALAEIAEGHGNLAQVLDVRTNDEIGQLATSFNSFTSRLRGIITTVNGAVATLRTVGQQLSATMEQTSSAVHQINANISSVEQQVRHQAGTVGETSTQIRDFRTDLGALKQVIDDQGHNLANGSAAIEQMVANVASVTQTLDQSKQEFESLMTVSEQGLGIIEAVVSSISDLALRSESLSQANEVIQAIASQTNLLAMNAAIEAAHAGEAGKGFAVVADEIRSLAENSAEQSKDITKNLEALTEGVATVVRTAGQAADSFQSISDSIRNAMLQQRQIAASMEEQTAGNQQVLEALENIIEQGRQVQDQTARLSAGTDRISSQMSMLEGISAQIAGSMTEMAQGTGDINRALGEVMQLTGDNTRAIKAVESEMEGFKSGD